jgi:hypothetical protein
MALWVLLLAGCEAKVSTSWREVGAGRWVSSAQGTSVQLDEQLGFEFAARGAGVRFGAVKVTRGQRQLAATGAKVSAAGARLQVASAEFTQTFEQTPGGAEQQWLFSSRPRGQGALEVRLPVQNAYAGVGPEGLRFRAGSGLVRYGHGT